MYLKNYHIHFIGIGGVGMSGIAKILLELTYKVSGSDIILSKNTQILETLGAIIFFKHKAENIYGANVVVFSSAIEMNNVEIKAAIKKKIPIISRAEMLSELMKQKYSIAVSGTHGKTSTTALIANLLKRDNLDPTIIAGGTIREINSNALTGQGNFIVAETDESDGSLPLYSPTIAIITNIDKDHLDFYQDINSIKEIFSNFINNIPFYGIAILCMDSKAVREIIPQMSKKFITYGINSNADLQAKQIKFYGMKSQFNITYMGKKQGIIKLNLPGMHSIYNALASIAVGFQLAIPFNIIKTSMKKAKNVKRRMEIKGIINEALIIDDYAHHPTEILAVLDTAEKIWPNNRKITIFQPHRYTRTKSLFNEFLSSFKKTDIIIILPIYSAGEKNTEIVSSKDLYLAIKKNKPKEVFYEETFENCIEKIKFILKRKDILLTIGAGDVYKIGEIILDLPDLYAK